MDALCDRLGIDNSKRVLHGALLDAEILADVFLMMTGGQIALLADETEENAQAVESQEEIAREDVDSSGTIVFQATSSELEAHEAFMVLINKKSKENCIWLKRMETESIQ